MKYFFNKKIPTEREVQFNNKKEIVIERCTKKLHAHKKKLNQKKATKEF